MSMEEAIAQAQKAHRSTIEQTYTDRCTISELRNEKDPVSKISTQRRVVIYSDIPCRLSICSSPSVVENDGTYKTAQSITLFLNPDTEIRPGSKIAVTQGTLITAYKRSGQPAVYGTHQEIELELWKERA